jgi:hypothetical protein
MLHAGFEAGLQSDSSALERLRLLSSVIASEAKQSGEQAGNWIASSRSLSSGAHSRDPLAPRNDGGTFPEHDCDKEWNNV